MSFAGVSSIAAGLPRIPSNILAVRLKELQAAGLIRRAPHSSAPDRAIVTGVVEVLRGHGDLVERFANTFHLAA